MRNQANQGQPTMIHYAMNTGVVVGAYYIIKFCLFPLSFVSAFSGMLFIGLTLMVPYLIFKLVKTYRDRHLGGHIEYFHAFLYAVLIMMFGSLLASVAHYIYFAYIDGGAMVEALEKSINQFMAIDLSLLENTENENAIAQFNQYIEMMRTTAIQVRAMTPIDITLGMLSNNLSWSFFVAFFIALFVSKRKRNTSTTTNQTNNQ